MQRLIVVEATEEPGSEVVRFAFVFNTGIFTRNYFQEVLFEKIQKSKGNYSIHPADDFDYRSIVLWLSLGCVGVFVSLQSLRCLLKKSEKSSEEYRLSRHNHEAIDDTKGNSTVSNDWTAENKRLVWIMLPSIKIIFKVILSWVFFFFLNMCSCSLPSTCDFSRVIFKFHSNVLHIQFSEKSKFSISLNLIFLLLLFKISADSKQK